jgi:hypothetical protein
VEYEGQILRIGCEINSRKLSKVDKLYIIEDGFRSGILQNRE